MLPSIVLRVSGSSLALPWVFSSLSSIVLEVPGSSPSSSSLALPWVPSTNCHSLLPSGILCQVRSSSLLSTSEGVLSWISPVVFARTRLSPVFDSIGRSSSITYVSPASITASGGSSIVGDWNKGLISKSLMLTSTVVGLYSSIHSFSRSLPLGLSSTSFTKALSPAVTDDVSSASLTNGELLRSSIASKGRGDSITSSSPPSPPSPPSPSLSVTLSTRSILS